MKHVLAQYVHRLFHKSLPKISNTEREALEAGGVGFEGELFTGTINWRAFLSRAEPNLSPEELEFINGPLAELMPMLSEYEFSQKGDLSAEVWQHLLSRGFMGLVIPKQYGGLGFSNYGHARIIETIATRSPSAAVTVMVPNSLGPSELLMHYGTQAQRDYYLPRLAKGLEIPCFGLTGPWAGSDAASLPDVGVICKELVDGKEVLGMRVTCSKRYITLAPVATLIGLALRVKDPENLLGQGDEPGISLALIPRNHPGLEIGARHYPMQAAFMNGTIVANEMFVSLDHVIGGAARVGQGWKMLMECLATGRAISLPSMGTASAKMTARTVSAYSVLREQFGLPIAKFHGVASPLSEIAQKTYSMEATRRFALASLDAGEKPAVASGILKYHLTEGGRTVVGHGMDILGGKGICQGPSNFLGFAWQYAPIGITVEGANILTRSLIIFGQGALRCHPYLLKEVHCAESGDAPGLLATLGAHLRHVLKLVVGNNNFSANRSVERSAFATSHGAQYAGRITRAARSFALCAELSLLFLGASLKKMELLSGRLGDALSNLYMASACLKRLESAGESSKLNAVAKLALESHLYQTRLALMELADNMPSKLARFVIYAVARPCSIPASTPSDHLRLSVADSLSFAEVREPLTQGVWAPLDEQDAIGVMEVMVRDLPKTKPIAEKVKQQLKSGKSYKEALDSLSPDDRDLFRRYRENLEKVVSVDAFEATHQLPIR